jgi:two-component system heavy metal sensor histidine kinase CusS
VSTAPVCRVYSISRRLSWQLATQTAAGLLLLCACLWGVTNWLFDSKHQQAWQTKAGIVQEVLRATAPRGEQAVAAKLAALPARRMGSYLVVQTADGREIYRDRDPGFDVGDEQTRAGAFEVDAPAWAGGKLRGTLVLDCTEDAQLLTALAIMLAAAALAGGASVGLAAFWRVRRGLAPVHELAAQTRAIDVDHLDQRVGLACAVEELQPAVEQLNALMDRLERAVRQLEAFNADVAHELRTPLAALIGHTELALSRERSGEALRETLAGNLEELHRLSTIVNDMLFLAQADRGAKARRGPATSLAALVRDVVEFHEAPLDDAEVSVRIEGDVAAPVDVSLVKRALSNLLGNATRYARRGSTLVVRIGAGADRQVRVEVENHGETIEPEALPRIFDRFFRADAAREAGPAGEAPHHGLGLAIVAAIARMHEGHPWAESRAGVTRVGLSLGVGQAG